MSPINILSSQDGLQAFFILTNIVLVEAVYIAIGKMESNEIENCFGQLFANVVINAKYEFDRYNTNNKY